MATGKRKTQTMFQQLLFLPSKGPSICLVALHFTEHVCKLHTVILALSREGTGNLDVNFVSVWKSLDSNESLMTET